MHVPAAVNVTCGPLSLQIRCVWLHVADVATSWSQMMSTHSRYALSQMMSMLPYYLMIVHGISLSQQATVGPSKTFTTTFVDCFQRELLQ
jgi:hypothetical protein